MAGDVGQVPGGGGAAMKADHRRQRLAYYREISTFLRDVLIAGLIVFCILRPDVVRSWLGSLGVSKATVLGFELTPGGEQELAETIDTLRQQRDAAIFERNSFARQAAEALREVERLRGSDPQLRGTIAALETSVRAPATTPPPTERAARLQTELVENARRTIGSEAGWAVVYGADRNLDSAGAELAWARRNGIEDVAAVRRQNSYRSVAFAADAQAAEALLPIVRRRRADAYVVNLQTWCPNPVEREGFRECA